MNSEHRHTSDMSRPERLIKRSGVACDLLS